MSKNLTNVPAHIAKFVKGLELTPVDQFSNMTPKQRIDAAGFGLKLELTGKLYAGFALMGLKEEMGHGQYMAELAKRMIPTSSAARCVNLSKLATRVPASNFPTLVNLEASKLELMTKWDDSELKEFCNGEEVRGITFVEAQDMSVRDVKAQLKEAQTSNNELEQELEKKNIALAKADDQIRLYKKKQNSIEGFDYPPSVQRVRIESSVLGSQAIQCLDDMEQFMVELAQATDLNKDKKKQEAEFSAGACTLYVNLKSVYSKASYLLKWFEETVGDDYMPTDPVDTPLLTQEEAMQIFNMREVMLIEHSMEKQARESQRKSNRKKNKKTKK